MNTFHFNYSFGSAAMTKYRLMEIGWRIMKQYIWIIKGNTFWIRMNSKLPNIRDVSFNFLSPVQALNYESPNPNFGNFCLESYVTFSVTSGCPCIRASGQNEYDCNFSPLNLDWYLRVLWFKFNWKFHLTDSIDLRTRYLLLHLIGNGVRGGETGSVAISNIYRTRRWIAANMNDI